MRERVFVNDVHSLAPAHGRCQTMTEVKESFFVVEVGKKKQWTIYSLLAQPFIWTLPNAPVNVTAKVKTQNLPNRNLKCVFFAFYYYFFLFLQVYLCNILRSVFHTSNATGCYSQNVNRHAINRGLGWCAVMV